MTAHCSFCARSLAELEWLFISKRGATEPAICGECACEITDVVRKVDKLTDDAIVRERPSGQGEYAADENQNGASVDGVPAKSTDFAREDHMKGNDERLTYKIEEAGKLLGVGRNTVYEAAKRGDFPTIRIGKRLLVPKAALDRLLAGETA